MLIYVIAEEWYCANKWHVIYVCAHTRWIHHVCPAILFFYVFLFYLPDYLRVQTSIFSSFLDLGEILDATFGRLALLSWPTRRWIPTRTRIRVHSWVVASLGKWIGPLWFRWTVICHQISTIKCQAQPTTLTGGLASISWQRVWASQIWTEMFWYMSPEGNIWCKRVVQHVFRVSRCVNIFQEQFSTSRVRRFEMQG